MAHKSSHRGRYFGCCKPKLIVMHDPADEAELPDPRMNKESWVQWILWTRELERQDEIEPIQDCV
jgi:hypothetical protein